MLTSSQTEGQESRRTAISDLPRLSFATLPTPLEEARNLSKALGGPRIFLKRDDLTGAALGGNKVRKLEFILGRIVADGYDSVIVPGGYQSNMARITAALANRCGLRANLVLGGVPGEAMTRNGNLLLDRLLGADISYIETKTRWEFGDALDKLQAQLTAAGHNPYLVPLGGSSPEGMAGYVEATMEIERQCREMSLSPDQLYVAVGSGGTFCGLLLGSLNSPLNYEVVGVSVSRKRDYLLEKLPTNIAAGAEVLGLRSLDSAAALSIYDDHVGPAYGEMTDDCRAAIELVARTEGVFLDPVYSGKSMAALIDHVRRGLVGKDDTVIFLHTGGSPALFAYEKELLGPEPLE